MSKVLEDAKQLRQQAMLEGYRRMYGPSPEGV